MLEEKNKLLRELRINRDQRGDHPSPGHKRALGAVAAALILIGAGAAYFLSRGERFEVKAATAVPPASAGTAAAVLQATGYVTARRKATVSAQITGTLSEVLIEEGERVEAGQVLARLENDAQRAQLRQAQAQLEAAQAVRDQLQVQLDQARRDLVRAEDLMQRKLVAQQELETARLQVESLAAQIQSQQKQIELARAAMAGAQVQLNHTVVRAPFSGIIVTKAAQAGEIISPISAGGGFTRTGVGTIVDMESLEIEVDVNETYINRVKAGQPAQAVLDAYPSWTIPARLLAIVPTADRSKATVKVRVAIEEKDPRILPDMGVRVTFLEDAPQERSETPSGVLVPASAIVQRNGGSVVFVIDAERARARSVTAGQTFGDLRLVEGLPSGALVVREPPSGMNDGARISVRNE